MSTMQPGPGWYPDPQNSANQRYWDGTQWTNNVMPSNPNPYGNVSTPTNYSNVTQTTSGNAIASLVISFLCAPVGIVFGHIAISEIDKSNGMKSGKGLAIAGLVIGYISVVFGLLIFLGSV
jgi:peptidyl-prolyl cis-trans isomerase B (cyclophilin B)